MLATFVSKLKTGARRTTLTVSAVVIGSIAPLGMMTTKAFAVAPDAPGSLKAYVGGNSIGLVWQPASTSTPTSYNIYRNGSYYANIAAYVNDSGNAQRYIDSSVTTGTSYSYYVTSLNASSEESAASNTVNVTHPTTPYAVPTITVDTTGLTAGEISFLNAGKTTLQNWYPKFVTYLNASSVARSSFTLAAADLDNAAGIAQYGISKVTIDKDWIASYGSIPYSQEIFIHEGTHLITYGEINPVPWITEGFANYIGSYIYGGNDPVNPVGASQAYLTGYNETAYMFNYIAVNFNKPNFVKDLFAYMRTTGGSVDPFFQAQTSTGNGDLTVGEVWTTITGTGGTGTRVSSPWEFKNGWNMCTDLPGGDIDNNTKLWLYTCNGSVAQQWTYFPDVNNPSWGVIRTNVNGGKCMHAQNNATANGTDVVIYDCNLSTAGMRWAVQTNGLIKNIQSGRCLAPQGGSSAVGTQMEILDCNSTYPSQQWGVRPLNLMQNQGSATTAVQYCADSETDNPGAGFSYAANNACDWDESQFLEFVQSSPGSNDGYYTLYNRTVCLDSNGATTSGSYVLFKACNGSANQKWVRNPSMRLGKTGTTLCLETVGSSTSEGAYLVINTCNSNATQKWHWATQ